MNKYLAAAALLIMNGIAYAGDRYENHQELMQQAAKFIARQITVDDNSLASVEAQTLDNRLLLEKCPVTPEFSLPYQHKLLGRVSVKVRCQQAQKSWAIIMPVMVRIEREMLVLKAPVNKGDTIAASDIRTEMRDSSTLYRGWLSQKEHAVGKLARRNLSAGSVISERDLQHAVSIKRGERVKVLSGDGRFVVSAMGEAMASAQFGEMLRVKNLKSGRIIEGKLMASGQVMVSH